MGGSLLTLSNKIYLDGKVMLEWNINGANDNRTLDQPLEHSCNRTATRWNHPATNAREDRANWKKALSQIVWVTSGGLYPELSLLVVGYITSTPALG